LKELAQAKSDSHGQFSFLGPVKLLNHKQWSRSQSRSINRIVISVQIGDKPINVYSILIRLIFTILVIIVYVKNFVNYLNINKSFLSIIFVVKKIYPFDL
jgi:hypothetical protein